MSGTGNELIFFADTTTPLGPNVTVSQTINNVPLTLSLNTLTLNGKGLNENNTYSVFIGDNASTWTIGDGTTSLVNLNSTKGGGNPTDDVAYIIGANLTLNGGTGNITTFTGNSNSPTGAVFSGNITGSGQGITKSGSSLLILSGNNTYTGTTLVTGGVLRLASANALSGGIGATGGTSALTINGGVVALGAGNFSRGLGTGSSQFQIIGGTSGFSSFGGPSVITVNGNASQEVVWGSSSFNASKFVLNSSVADSSLTFTNKIDLNGITRTVQVNAEKARLSGDIRTTSGTAGLTKEGNGTLVLTGNNTYNGNTTISAGTLSVGAASNFGSGSSGLIMGNGATLQITGTTLTSISGLGHAVTFNSGNKGFDIHNAANTFTVDQVLNQGTGTFTKSGVGTLVLNQNNTFTGATAATGGGKLVLDYTTNNGSKLSDTTALTLNGSAIVLKGGSHTEVVGSTILGVTGGIAVGNSISRDGGTSRISLGAISIPNNLGANLSTLAISEANLAITTTTNTNGILPAGRITVGSHFGANDGSNNIVAFSSYLTATTAGGGNKDTDVNQLTGGGTMAATLNSYSLRIANSGNSDVLNLGGFNLSLFNNGTLLYAGGGDNNYTIEGTGFITSASGNQPFIINTYTGTTLIVNSLIMANANTSRGIIKAGEGTLVVGAANSNIAGTSYIQQGILRLTNKDGLGATTAGTVVQGGAALELSNNIAVGAEALDLNGAGISNGGALRNLSGNNSFAGAITTGASGARINSDAGSLTLTGGIATTLTQDVTFGGAGNTTVSTTAIRGGGSLIKDGNGTLTLSAVNTYTGATLVSAGTLFVSGSLVSDVTVSDTATLAGGGTVDDLILGGGSFFDLFLAVNSADSLAATTISFSTAGFGIDNLLANGAAVNWGAINNGTYTLITGTLNSTNLGNFGSANAYDIGGGRTAYFQEGSLQLVVAAAIPEPRAALLGALGLLLLLRRKR